MFNIINFKRKDNFALVLSSGINKLVASYQYVAYDVLFQKCIQPRLANMLPNKNEAGIRLPWCGTPDAYYANNIYLFNLDMCTVRKVI